DCTPLDLRQFIAAHPEWSSPWTRLSVTVSVKRAFNWACQMRMIHEYPFHGYRTNEERPPMAPMPDGDFRLILRRSRPSFRRLVIFLRFTGCRPGEAAALEWSDIDWTRAVAILRKHKTAKKTRKPRILPLPPVVVKLLRWLERHRH